MFINKPQAGGVLMLNLASDLEVEDFTPEELETVKLHMQNNQNLNFKNMVDAWRDENGDLCVSYQYEFSDDEVGRFNISCITGKATSRWWCRVM